MSICQQQALHTHRLQCSKVPQEAAGVRWAALEALGAALEVSDLQNSALHERDSKIVVSNLRVKMRGIDSLGLGSRE